MSTHSLHTSSALMKRLAYSLASLCAAALLLLLPQTQHALPLSARPANVVAMLVRPAALLLPGSRDFWHTEGNRILDAHNQSIRISGVNWSGFETPQAIPGGLDAQDYRVILRTIQANGYNTVRIPFSNEMVETPTVPNHIRFSNPSGPINADLRNLTSLEILDNIVAYSGKLGLKIILDNHRSEAGSSAQESGLWYTPRFPESAWIEDWTALARRYSNTSTVIGMDLRNEPHNADKGGSCWDCGGLTDWHQAAGRAGDAILAVNPRLLIFVAGVDTYAGDTYWWGGNLEGVRRSPVRLSVPNRLVYSAHEYGPTEYAQPWFNTATSPATLAGLWRRHWAYISEAGIAPVWIGEFGTSNSDADVQSSTPGSEGQWFTSLVEFFGSHPALGWTYWGVNGEDRYGLLDIAYSSQPANQLKAEALANISSSGVSSRTPAFAAAIPTPMPPTYPTLPTTFSQPSAAAEAASYTHPTTQPSFSTESHRQPTAVTHSHPSESRSSTTSSVQSSITASIHQAVSTANLNLAEDLDTAAR